ncbi:Fet3 protein [Mycena sp. CBHHK59/15]|nr:Fet3 protein [Mycena sp. CBHHK59/15]
MRSLPVLLATLAAPPALAAVKEYWWNLTYVDNVNPDGLSPRRAIGVNGTWPPPPLDVSATDTLVVHATNSLDTVSTLHHHGMFFNSTSWMDGAVGVSECGIPPGGQFTYNVAVNESGQTGTYWVHAHASGQYVDGLRAPLVIHAEKEPYAYDGEFTVILGDWYHDEHSVLIEQFVNIANPGGAEPVPDAGLIYFAQNGTYLAPKAGTSPDDKLVGYNENATLPFEAGKTYRLRVVNTSAFAMFFFWIDGHDMSVIEVDGTDIEAYPIDLLTLTVAQRYSVLVKARNDTSANWAVHANMDTDMFDTVPDTLNPNSTASITYDSSLTAVTDAGVIAAYADVDDIAMVPLVAVPAPPATRTITLEVSFDTMDDGTNHAMFNRVTYNSPLVPAVLSALTLGSNATVADAYGPQSFVLDHMEVVDIVVQNGDAGKHPLCPHPRAEGAARRPRDGLHVDDPALNPPIAEGQANPLRRDTVQIESGASATLRVVADNPARGSSTATSSGTSRSGSRCSSSRRRSSRSRTRRACRRRCTTTARRSGCRERERRGARERDGLAGLSLGPYPQNNGWHARGIGAMAGCVLTAVLGMLTVVWYAMGGRISEEEEEHEVREQIEAKARRGRFFGLLKKKND